MDHLHNLLRMAPGPFVHPTRPPLPALRQGPGAKPGERLRQPFLVPHRQPVVAGEVLRGPAAPGLQDLLRLGAGPRPRAPDEQPHPEGGIVAVVVGIVHPSLRQLPEADLREAVRGDHGDPGREGHIHAADHRVGHPPVPDLPALQMPGVEAPMQGHVDRRPPGGGVDAPLPQAGAVPAEDRLGDPHPFPHHVGGRLEDIFLGHGDRPVGPEGEAGEPQGLPDLLVGPAHIG